jgi:ABC-2 type transport system permease protein
MALEQAQRALPIAIDVQDETSSLGQLRWAISDGLVITRRNLTHVRHVPEKLLDVTVQPIMFVLLFAYVFGSAISVPGGNYREYLMAGIFAQTMAFSTASSAVSISDDMAKGVIERFRSLPMSRSAVLLGRTGADLASNSLGLTVLVLSGLTVGWRMHNGVLQGVAGLALLLLFAYAMSWVGTLLGLLVRAPDAAQTIGFVVMFPLTFVANTFVPTQGMPTWLRTIAEWNPLSAVVAATRQLFGNPSGGASTAWPLEHAVFAALIWCLLILAVALPLATYRYQRATTR